MESGPPDRAATDQEEEQCYSTTSTSQLKYYNVHVNPYINISNWGNTRGDKRLLFWTCVPN